MILDGWACLCDSNTNKCKKRRSMKLNRNVFLILPLALSMIVSLFPVSAKAQNANEQLQIERDVWIPFFAASNKFDAEGFLAICSEDLIRIGVDQKEVFGFERYANQIREGFKRAKERGVERNSEVRFTERNIIGDYAYESGYFKSNVQLGDGEKQVRYTRFEFVLRKENGKWKILVDRDTLSGEQITEAIYIKAAPMTSMANNDKTNQMNTNSGKASGTFEVKMLPQKDENGIGDPAVGRMSLDKKFDGSLKGASKGQMLTFMTSVEGSAGYVAIELFKGTLNGKEGTFAMQHSGLMNRGQPSLTITVVPDSGTEELTGISGKMTIKIEGGKHFYDFEYSLTENKPK